MAWYNGNVTNYHVMWSRVRIYRNIHGMEFSPVWDHKKALNIMNKATMLLEKNGFHLSDDPTPKGYMKYAEIGYADKGFVESDSDRMLYMNEPCNLAIALGGEDFICISSILPSLAIREAYNDAREAELMLDLEIDFAYDENMGYISPAPTRTGHGVVFSVNLFLPALSGLSEIKRIVKKAASHGYRMYPMTTYEDNPGGFYVIEYAPDIYVGLNDAERKISDFAKYVISLEKDFEGRVFGDNIALLNKAWRSVGILEYGSTLAESEMLSLISNIRLTHCLGCSEKLPYLIDIGSLNTLQTELMNTYIYSDICDGEVEADTCDKERARRLNEYVKALRMREVV